MRYQEILRESVLNQQPIGTVIELSTGSDFSAMTHFYIKTSDGRWHKITRDGYERGHPKFVDGVGSEIADETELDTAFSAGKISRPIEGIAPGEAIKNSIQVHALPDGSILKSPFESVDSVYQKQGQKFVAIAGTNNGKDITGNIVPG